jgi:hypothetical protein
VLIGYLEEQQEALGLTSLTIIELGSGTGACGLAAAGLGAKRVLLTDKLALIPTLQHNISLNSFDCSVECRELTWTTQLQDDRQFQGADLVLMSDCLNVVYGDQHALALAATLRRLLERRLQTRPCQSLAPAALLSQARRGSGASEAMFLAECNRLGLIASLVSTSHLPSSVVAAECSVECRSQHSASCDDCGKVEVVLYALRMQ